MIKFSMDMGALLTAKDIEKIFQLSKGQRTQLNRKLGRYVVKQTKGRIRTQNDVRGGKLAKRQKGNKRVLAKMAKGLVVFAGPNRATMTWKNNLTGSIALQHHQGISERWTAAKMKRLMGQPDYSKPATREQARSLLAVGFKVKSKKGYKRPTQKWILENMNIGHAGKLLRILKNQQPKKIWFVGLQKRQVLGATKQDVLQMVNTIQNFIHQK
jgi:hypothetical protein